MFFRIFLFCIFSHACSDANENLRARPLERVEVLTTTHLKTVDIHKEGSVVRTRFDLPDGFSRPDVDENSFANYLRNLPLKSHGSPVKLFDGTVKINTNVHEAVVDLPIGVKDLHQCADAIIRLRAEYLWNKQAYDEIHFNFTNGFRADYSSWMEGKRIQVSGNSVRWIQANQPSNTYEDFWKYMEVVYTYAGTLSLAAEMVFVANTDMRIGDVFILGGSPGHAVIVVDMAENRTTHEKLFMLAQSYMPAQELHILVNPNDDARSPWFASDYGAELHTPEWTFSSRQLKRFRE